MGIEGLGRLFNFVPIAAGTLLALKDMQGYTFCVTGNDTFTLKTAATYNGSVTACATIANYWTNTSTSGAAEWVAATQAAASTVVIASGAAMFYVDSGDLPSAAKYLEVTVAASGLVYAIPHDLFSQRIASNLPQLSGSGS
jgi:hypothetical protein